METFDSKIDFCWIKDDVDTNINYKMILMSMIDDGDDDDDHLHHQNEFHLQACPCQRLWAQAGKYST